MLSHTKKSITHVKLIDVQTWLCFIPFILYLQLKPVDQLIQFLSDLS